MDLNNKKDWSIIFPLIIAILIVGSIIRRNIEPKKILKWNFKGPVEKVWYDDKGSPYITVRGREYDLFYTAWHSKIIFHVGDTVIKQRGDRRIKIIRRDTRDTIYYNSVD